MARSGGIGSDAGRTRGAGPRPRGLLYPAALILVLSGVPLLILGLVQDHAAPIVAALGCVAAALVLLWAGVARSSGGTKPDRHG